MKILAFAGSSRSNSLKQTLPDIAAMAAVEAGAQATCGDLRDYPVPFYCGELGMLVIPQSFSLGTAHEAFDETHKLRDAKVADMVRAVGMALADTVRKLKG